MNSRKGQAGIITILFMDVTFIVLYALVLAKLLNQWSTAAIASGNFTGLEAFAVGNLNLVVIVGVVLVNIAFFSLGGSQ